MTPLRPTARVARGATYLFVQGFLAAIVGLVYFVFLAHALTNQEMGIFALLSFILNLPQVLGTFALPSAAIKYISQYLAENDPEKAKAVVSRVLQIGFLTSAVIFVLLFIPAEQVSSLLFATDTNSGLLRILAFCSIFSILNIEITGFLQGMQKMLQVSILGLTYTIISTSLGVYLLLFGWRLYAVVFGWLAGFLTVSIIGLILTIKYLGVLEKPCPVRPLLNFSFPLYVSNGINFWVGWVDQLLLVSYMSLLHGAEEAQRILGIYSVAIRAATVPGLFSTSIVAALFPQLSELYAQQGLNSIKDAFRISTRYAVLIGFPLIFGLATLAYPVIILFGGWKYVEATGPLVIISIAAAAGTLGVAISPILLTLERTKIASVLSVVSVILSFLLSVFALAYLGLGMIGTAWARTFASIITLVLSIYVLTRYVPVSFDKEAFWKASVASILMAISIIGLDAVRMFLSPSSYKFLEFRLYLLPVYVLVGAFTYVVFIIGLRTIKKQDLELIREYLPKKMKWIADWLSRIAMVE